MQINSYLPDNKHMTVQLCGKELRLLCKFSEKQNILLRFIEGNMIAAFIAPDKGIEQIDEAVDFHRGWDDLAPWVFGDYEMIGANHGSIFAFRVRSVRHWCFPEDIGKVFVDEAGNEFVLVAVENLAELVFHSRAAMKNGRIKFAKSICGNLKTADKRQIRVETFKRIQLPNHDRSVQTVHNRYNSVKIFADGKLLEPGSIVRCSEVKMVLDMDLCPPDALCEYLVKNPGKYVAPNAPELESMIHMSLVYTFQSNNTMQADAEIEFLRDINQNILYGLLQYYGEKFFAVHEKFVPKLKPFVRADFYTYPEMIDLGKIWKVPENSPIEKTFTGSDCLSENDVPCRYIDFFGSGKSRQLGVALGYSRLRGITKAGLPPRKGINLILPASGKIYPYVLNMTGAEKGQKFTISAYRQFFKPIDGFNGSAFGHYEDGFFCFYMDCADGGEYTFSLPEKFAGKSFELFEQYGKVEFPNGMIPDKSGKLTVRFADKSGAAIKTALKK